jgi:hypothetical protein
MVDHGLILRRPMRQQQVPQIKDIADQHIGIRAVLLQEPQHQIGLRRQRAQMQVGYE